MQDRSSAAGSDDLSSCRPFASEPCRSLERFTATIDGCDDPQLVPALSRLCDLDALSCLERDRGWFLEHDLFAGAEAQAIVDQVDRLCVELRPRASDLVDAFGFGDASLAAPIGMGRS